MEYPRFRGAIVSALKDWTLLFLGRDSHDTAAPGVRRAIGDWWSRHAFPAGDERRGAAPDAASGGEVLPPRCPALLQVLSSLLVPLLISFPKKRYFSYVKIFLSVILTTFIKS